MYSKEMKRIHHQTTGYYSTRDQSTKEPVTLLTVLSVVTLVPCLAVIVICATAILVGYTL